MGRRGEEDCVWFGVDGCDRGCEVISVSDWPSGSSSLSSSSSSSTSPARFIEHRVSRLDTVAGVAIMYGVEVADVKRMNNLVTDRQMYALKTLQIPLPGRHPPSPCLSNGSHTSERTPPGGRSEILESLHSLRVNPERKASPAMSSLQGYYGFTSNGTPYRGFEIDVYSTGDPSYLDDGAFPQPSLSMNPPLSFHRKSRSLANGFGIHDCDLNKDVPPSYPDSDGWTRKFVKQYLKSEDEFPNRTPEKLLKEENGNGGWFSAITGKGLSLRNKASTRTNLVAEADAFNPSNGSSRSQDPCALSGGSSGFRKSFSTPSLQDEQHVNFPSMFSTTKWRLKPDFKAFSTSIITRPIFDGLAIPIGGRRSKASLD
ncbi:LysM and putative peptidoglycan-binding domain-containing protein [Drosera capensis]